MGKYEFLIDTGGYCFLCLGTKLLWSDDGNVKSEDEEITELQPKIFSFKDICQYLEINLGEVFREMGPVSSDTLSVLEQSEMKGVLCKECAHFHDLFSNIFLELEKIQMKLNYCLESIRDRMRNAEGVNGAVLAEFKEKMLRRPETLLQYGIVERLRSKTMEGCSKMAQDVLPRVVLRKAKIRVRSPTEAAKPPTIPIVSGIVAGPSVAVCVSEPPRPPRNMGRAKGNIKYGNVASSASAILPPQTSQSSSEKVPPAFDQACKQIPKTGKVRCRLCSKEFTALSTLKSHYNVVHLKLGFRCDICNATFSRTYTLRQHQQTAHLGQPFQCKYCPSLFSHLYKRNSHMKKDCQFRNSKLSLKLRNKRKVYRDSNLTSVVRQDQPSTTHEEPTKFQCYSCDKSFSRQNTLIQHQRTDHAGNKFICQFCLRSFNTTSSRNRHVEKYCPLKKVKPKIPLKKCDFCPRTFRHDSNRNRHMTTYCTKRSQVTQAVQVELRDVPFSTNHSQELDPLGTFILPDDDNQDSDEDEGSRPLVGDVGGDLDLKEEDAPSSFSCIKELPLTSSNLSTVGNLEYVFTIVPKGEDDSLEDVVPGQLNLSPK